ncbi:MAG: response regulator [Pseudomonadota bacterium]
MSADQTVYIIDDDEAVRDSMSMLLESVELDYQCFDSADEFLDALDDSYRGCLILDIRMPGMSGLELQKKLSDKHSGLPIIFMTGHGDVPMAVEAMRLGALDFLRKPVREEDFLRRVNQAMEQESGRWAEQSDRAQLQHQLATLTERESEVFQQVAEGQANKVIAANLGISERTVEVHRSNLMKKLQARSLADLVRIYLISDHSSVSK